MASCERLRNGGARKQDSIHGKCAAMRRMPVGETAWKDFDRYTESRHRRPVPVVPPRRNRRPLLHDI